MKKRLTLFFVLISGLLFGQSENYWIRKADFGAGKRERAVSFSINGKGYLATGVDTNETVKNDLWEYDALVDVWTQKASMPASVRRDACAFTIGDHAYVGVGIDSAEAFNGTILSDLWQYDGIANTWLQKADYPGGGGLGVYFATAFTIDNKGFVVCGKIGSDNYIDEVWEYKPLTDQWTQRGAFPGGERYQLSSFVIDDIAYVGLGADYNVYKEDMWEYHSGSDTWIRKTDFAGGVRGSSTTFTLGQRGFVCLGIDGGLKNDLWEYDPFQDTWTARASYDGSARKSASAFTISGNAYVGTGNGYSGKKASMYEYIPVAVLSVSDRQNSSSCSIYPDPVEDHFTMNCNNTLIARYRLLDCKGELLRSEQIQASASVRVERGDLPAGIYFLVADDRSGNAVVRKKMIFR